MKQIETSVGSILGIVGMATASDQIVAVLSAVAAVVCAATALVRELRAWLKERKGKGDGDNE